MADKIQFDEIFQIIGEFGAYQKILFILISINSFLSLEAIWVNFIGYENDHWCYVAELAHLPFDLQRNISIPMKGDAFDKCHMFDLNYSSFTLDDFLAWNRTAFQMELQ